MKSEAAVTVEITLASPHRRRVRAEAPSPEQTRIPNRIPRITRQMALAITFQELVDHGTVRNCAELALVGYVSRARITQIANLLHLTLDIQEALLHLAANNARRRVIGERDLRKLTQIVDWHEQRRYWRLLASQSAQVTSTSGLGDFSRVISGLAP